MAGPTKTCLLSCDIDLGRQVDVPGLCSGIVSGPILGLEICTSMLQTAFVYRAVCTRAAWM